MRDNNDKGYAQDHLNPMLHPGIKGIRHFLELLTSFLSTSFMLPLGLASI